MRSAFYLFVCLFLFQISDAGFYIYIEASGKLPGESARLSLTNVSGEQCLTFFYHMLGFHIGQLNVLVNGTVVMSLVGEQGWEWHMAQVGLNGSQNKVTFNLWGVDICLLGLACQYQRINLIVNNRGTFHAQST